MKIRTPFILALIVTAAIAAVLTWWNSSPASAPTEAIGNNNVLDPDALEYVSSGEARSPEEERKGFRLPPGFEIQLFASEPDIGKPMNMAFDERGRLGDPVESLPLFRSRIENKNLLFGAGLSRFEKSMKPGFLGAA